MANSWKRDILAIPLIIGLAVALFTFVLPRVFRDKMEISYAVDSPWSYLDDPMIGQVTVHVNGVLVSDLVAQKVRIWNSGDVPLEQLPIRFVFSTFDTSFAILSLSHLTTPRHEFGSITESESDQFSRRLIYELLNPGDEDFVTFLVNTDASLQVYSKAAGLSVRSVEPRPSPRSLRDMFAGVSTIASILAALLALVLRSSQEKLKEIFRTLFGSSGSGSE